MNVRTNLCCSIKRERWIYGCVFSELRNNGLSYISAQQLKVSDLAVMFVMDLFNRITFITHPSSHA